MIRKQIYITNKQDKVFKKLASKDGTSASELMRRALDDYIDKKNPLLLVHEDGVIQTLGERLDPAINIANCVHVYGNTTDGITCLKCGKVQPQEVVIATRNRE